MFQQDARVYWTYIAPTATTGNNMKFLLNDGRIRHLIGEELKRIHGFREDFILGEGKTQQNKEMGNTVSPTVYKELLKMILTSIGYLDVHLENVKTRNKKRLDKLLS
jgi:site-specific DNA-cytosine methylase